jgi:hypothetical protein
MVLRSRSSVAYLQGLLVALVFLIKSGAFAHWLLGWLTQCCSVALLALLVTTTTTIVLEI